MKFFILFFFSFFISFLSAQPLFDAAINNLLDPSLKPFYFGVASGDPEQTSVIIWTKIWNENNQPVPVKWEIASDTLMQTKIATGEVNAVYFGLQRKN